METILHVTDLGRQPYRAALAVQERLVEERKAGRIPDTLLWVEHEPVYTLGRNASPEHVLYNAAERARQGIGLEQTGRGGDVTYHGPGQLVGYPILALGKEARRVVWYVDRLEEVLIRVLSDYGLTGRRDRANRGVWIGSEKIAALGVRIASGVTMHGFALNVRVNLDHYAGIIPCGIRDKGVTSLHRFVPSVSMDDVKRVCALRFAVVFERQVETEG